MFHIRWISILKFLYFNFFSDSFCITFLSDRIAASISMQILSFMFLIIMSGLLARTSLSVFIPWIHSTVISSCWLLLLLLLLLLLSHHYYCQRIWLMGTDCCIKCLRIINSMKQSL
jgi:hypothetical protein